MCMGGAPSPPPMPAPAAEQQDAAVVSARDAEMLRKRKAASNTILTSAQGVTGAAPVATKTLLGQ